MLRIFKRLNIKQSLGAIAFLCIQLFCTLTLPYITADVVNNGIIPGNISLIWTKGLIMIVLSIVSLFGAIFNTLLFSKVSYKLGNELRKDIYAKVLKFSKTEFDKFGTATLITRNTTDINTIQTLVEMSLKFIILAVANLFGGIIMTYLLSPKLAVVFIAIIPFLIISAVVIYRFANPLYSKIQKLIDKLNLIFREGLTGVKVIRSFNKENVEYEKYKEVNRECTKTTITAETIMTVFMPLVTMIISIATVAIVWIGGKGVNSGTMQVGTIMAAINYAVQITSGFGMLINVILTIPKGQVSAKRIHEVLDTNIDAHNYIQENVGADILGDPNTVGTGSHASQGRDEYQSLQQHDISLQFQNVTFKYSTAEKNTLENVTFTIDKGKTLAVIGSTGEGKSTLVNLIPRFYDVNKGTVKVNGANVKEIDKETLQDTVSLAPQKSLLFFGTIRSNMLLGKKDATDEEIWKALDMACATEFVKKYEDELDHVVEKDGGNFSGGQKQRLCIARTLLKEADIYIFDDSFSALDFKTDSIVRNNMKEKIKDKISIIIAQRISTIMNADLIAVLDGGKLVGLGTHKELEESNAVYKEIMESQFYRKEEIA
ncbi:MAG: ABC transporter ATP-binding protein/permease [Oscillospiraceae bacterium]|nr:ABC transporter ATP-binding protein/permease [Oscillospiraceae bacterium]